MVFNQTFIAFVYKSIIFSWGGLGALYRFFALKYAADAACTVLRVDQVINSLLDFYMHL